MLLRSLPELAQSNAEFQSWFQSRWGRENCIIWGRTRLAEFGPCTHTLSIRAAWGGDKGWIAEMKVYAALHNHAGLYNADFNPPTAKDANTGWASGAWFIGPDGRTLAQMPVSTEKGDSKEFVLIYDVPIGGR